MENIDQSLSTLSEVNLVNLRLYDNQNFNDKKNYSILMCTIKLIKDSQRFAGQPL